MSHFLSCSDLFLFICINCLLDFIYLALDIVEAPLLRFLHLNHHLLNLLKLLKRICLHLFELFLLTDEHLKSIIFMLSKESMLDISLWIIQLHARVFLMIPMFVEGRFIIYHNRVTLFGLL